VRFFRQFLWNLLLLGQAGTTVSIAQDSHAVTVKVQRIQSTGRITTSPLNQDFITVISTPGGSCEVEYSRDAGTSKAIENKIQTVIYTLTDVY